MAILRIRNTYNTLKELNKINMKNGDSLIEQCALPSSWQDLIKAVVIHSLYVKKLTPSYINDVARTIRVIATCNMYVNPWELTAENTAFAYNVARKVQKSGKLSLNIDTAVNEIIDGENISIYSPIFPMHKKIINKEPKRKALKSSLNERESSAKLPDSKAFWEIVRIINTERPKSYVDALRFIQIRLLIITGHRVGEVSLYPLDWRRERLIINKVSSEKISKPEISVLLRHFAEKNRGTDEYVSYYENTQYIPKLFEEVFIDSINCAIELTQPLRDRLEKQVKTGRLFPEYGHDEYVSVLDFYPKLSGSPFIYVDEKQDELISEYKESYAQDVLHKIHKRQIDLERSNGSIRKKVYHC